MSSGRSVTKLQPTDVTYRGFHIKLKHRPDTNDWTYTITHNIPITLSYLAPRYETALQHAKQDIDALLSK